MKRISEFAVLFALLGMAACGGSKAPDKTKPSNKIEGGRADIAEPAREGRKATGNRSVVAVDFLIISEVRLSPAEITAAVDISAEPVMAAGTTESVEFAYRWFVDSQEVADATDSTLKSGNFRKHQWVFCLARATAGKKVSEWVKSDWVRIANSTPQLEPGAVENITVPGRFSYQVTASDVDDDELTYELIAPLDAGIELDKKSGLLTWNLDNKIVEKLGETIVISFAVSDNEGKRCTGDLTLRFEKKTVTKKSIINNS